MVYYGCFEIQRAYSRFLFLIYQTTFYITTKQTFCRKQIILKDKTYYFVKVVGRPFNLVQCSNL